MANSYFRFKRFTIHQELTAMKVGTDGVVLGLLAETEGAGTALDIGTGTGLIALMLKQRAPHLRITAIDLHPDAVRQARANAEASPWNVEVLECSAQRFAESGRAFDLIVCNPPYFTRSLPAPDAARTLARHNDSLPFGELSRAASRLLATDGRFWVILPYSNAAAFAAMAVTDGLHATRLIAVRTKEGKEPKRAVLRFERHPGPLEQEELVMERRGGSYTDNFRALTRDFYLDK